MTNSNSNANRSIRVESNIPTVWAIRENSTGFYLPMSWLSMQSSFSFAIPAPRFPRLFRTRLSAKMALNAWLKGEWHGRPCNLKTKLKGGELVGVHSQSYITPVPGRHRDDMEVVEMELIPVVRTGY